LSSTLWSNNLSLFHSPHTNNPQYNTRMSALTVSVQSLNSKKHHSIKGYCSMLLTVPDPKYKLCYLQSYKEWTHTTDLSVITQTTAVHESVPHLFRNVPFIWRKPSLECYWYLSCNVGATL
jgi:hypothetical protein